MSTLILGFDTCFGACSVAVGEPGSEPVERFEAMDKGHSERIVPMIGEVLAEAGRVVGDVRNRGGISSDVE